MSAATDVAAVRSRRERVSLWRTPRTRSLLLLTVIGAVGGLAYLAARLYTDVLWFEELGQVDVLWTTLQWRILAAAVVGLGTACFVLLNLRAAERAIARSGIPARHDGLAGRIWDNRGLLKPLVAIACGVIALESRPAESWQLLLVWTKRSSFGIEEPLFHRDAGFFVFSLPLYREVARWLLETVVLAAAASAAAYAAGGASRAAHRGQMVRAARVHLLVLAATLLAIVAWRLRLEQFLLALPHDRIAPGPTFTDVNVRLPALRVLTFVTLTAAAMCLYACVCRVRVVAVVVLALLAAAAYGAKADLPAAVHLVAVAPQALSRERPHVRDAIVLTRRAYGIDRIRTRPLPHAPPLATADVTRARATIANVPLWDEDVLRPAMNELQSIGRYYDFPSVSVGRHLVDGKPQVMTVGARQVALRRLDPGDRSWATDRFAYTHGYGLAAVRGGDADGGRYPRFAQHGFDARSNPLGIREPRVYFGEQPGADPPYVVLNSGRGEVDAPASGDDRPTHHYAGSGGIAASDLLRRTAFAARFGDVNLLLSETVTPRSRIVLHRNAGDRLRTLAPFLRWDERPQTAIVDGRIHFLFDGYATSDSFPYSAPVRVGGDEVNYVRASARAAIDAFSGRVRIYAASDDPITRAWRGVYPGLFLPASSMPDALRAQLRYPQELFEAQVDAYQAYHAEDATAFWNGSDAWARALQVAGPIEQAGEIRFPDPARRVDADERRDRHVAPRTWRMEPAYGLARMPGDVRERFMVTMPFTPRGRQNLVGYLAGSLDARGAPRLSLLSLPRDRLTVGPTQATRRILSSPGVVRRMELVNRESRDLGRSGLSRTVLGAPRIVPIAGTLVHVQPLFLTAGGEGVPRLQLVTALVDGRVGYGRTLEAALRRSVAARSGR